MRTTCGPGETMGLMPDLTQPAVIEVEAIDNVEDAYELLRSVYSNSALPIGMRMRAAIEALPFEKPKLAVTAMVSGQEGIAALLEARLKRNAEARPKALAAPVASDHPLRRA
jgi:polysaccharide pyruvyl transferase WcaK-like protein